MTEPPAIRVDTAALAYHRRARTAWIAAALVSLTALLLLRRYAPAVAPYLFGNSSAVLCLIGAGYHHGWLHGHRDRGAAERESSSSMRDNDR